MNITAFYRPASPGERASQIDQLISERNELLAVLKAFPGFTDDAKVGDPWIEQMRTAIAKAEGRS
jgi:hypothetical protein